MKAMVLAAGLGTRLRPLTNERPKALVEVGGRTLLEIALARLRRFGITDVIVNAHHFAGMIQTYLQSRDNFGLNIQVSLENELLDTGGGVKKAAPFFLRDAADTPFLLHNVDVISDIDFGKMLASHQERGALATLAVQGRKTSRYLLFDGNSELCGREQGPGKPVQMVRHVQVPRRLAFCGIHVISPRFLRLMNEDGAFSIIEPYLRCASAGEQIVGFQADEYYWRDLGTTENLAQAEADFRSGKTVAAIPQ
jgi:NDP-sugar pyrophosphorylase family protein